jgi:hypothetical protein
MYEYSGAKYAIDLSPVRHTGVPEFTRWQDVACKIVYNSRSILTGHQAGF